MSTYTRLTLTALDAPLDFDAVSLDFDGTAVLSPDDFDQHDGGTRPDGTVEPATIVLVWDDTRWEVDGVRDLAKRWSADFACEAETFQEWDTRDADEQGAEGYRYRRGVLVASGSTQFVWDEVPA